MKLGIMQPYFFPYLGYFSLMDRCDKWIVFDTVQYIHKGWMNRNRILHPTNSWQYINVPIKKCSRGTQIIDVEINNSTEWSKRISGQLEHYRKKAPFFDEVRTKVIDPIMLYNGSSLSKLNVRSLNVICDYIGISTEIQIFSEMNLSLPSINGPGDWALEISKALGADEYINSPGGRDLFDSSKFEEADINLTIHNPKPFEYEQRGYEFISGLSIVDILMWNSKDDIIRYVKDRTF